jgi:electron transfer flavoprotein-quinone oxidoreductase
MLGILGLGFMYTNSDSVTIGAGITLNDLVENNLRPYDILEQLKAHPSVASFIEGGELKEYSAHLIPEGGYKKVPQLYDNGVMVVGDAAMLVNNMHWEGTNLALISGKIAGETAIDALKKNCFDKKILSAYKKNLEKTFVLKDLHTYRNLMDVMHDKRTVFMDIYFKKINAFFERIP